MVCRYVWKIKEEKEEYEGIDFFLSYDVLYGRLRNFWGGMGSRGIFRGWWWRWFWWFWSRKVIIKVV